MRITLYKSEVEQAVKEYLLKEKLIEPNEVRYMYFETRLFVSDAEKAVQCHVFSGGDA